MTSESEIAQRYLAMWNERDAAKRYKRVSDVWAPDGYFVDPVAEGRGYDEIAGILAGVQQKFADHDFRLIGSPERVGASMRLSWGLAPADRPAVLKGTDVLNINPDGRLCSVVGFFDLVPGSSDTPAWSVANWIGFWANPDPEVARKRIPSVVLPEIAGYWPYQAKVARGVDEYRDYILELLALVPDLKLTLEDHATENDNNFVRWSGVGTGPQGRIRCTGVDRIRTQSGKVVENRIFSDHAIFRTLAQRMAPRLAGQ